MCSSDLEDDGADVVASGECGEGLAELTNDLLIQGVELVGAVDRDRGDSVGDAEEEELGGHGLCALGTTEI